MSVEIDAPFNEWGNSKIVHCRKQKLPIEEIIRLYSVEKKTLEEIGSIGGVTRERIRQLLVANGFNKAEVIAKRRDELDKRDAEAICNAMDILKKAREERYKAKRLANPDIQKMIVMWADGVSLNEIARRLGRTRISVGVSMTLARRRGYDWFPYRRKGWKAFASPESDERSRQYSLKYSKRTGIKKPKSRNWRRNQRLYRLSVFPVIRAKHRLAYAVKSGNLTVAPDLV